MLSQPRKHCANKDPVQTGTLSFQNNLCHKNWLISAKSFYPHRYTENNLNSAVIMPGLYVQCHKIHHKQEKEQTHPTVKNPGLKIYHLWAPKHHFHMDATLKLYLKKSLRLHRTSFPCGQSSRKWNREPWGFLVAIGKLLYHEGNDL